MAEDLSIQREDWENYFGPLYKFIVDDEVTDVDVSAGKVFVTNCKNERMRAEETVLPDGFADIFAHRVANSVSKAFNKETPVLEAETETLRITVVHASAAVTGTAVSIRKSLPAVRMDEDNIVTSGYCSAETLQLLKDCVRARLNLCICGEPGSGKTECAKFLSTFIPNSERVITIEDNPEWHYAAICPDHDTVELKVGPQVDYTKAIKTCMRLNPTWIMLSEARSVEVKDLLTCLSTGVKGMTTIHTDAVAKIPDRMVNMAGELPSEARFLNNIYSFVDVGLLIRRKEIRCADGRYRTIRSIEEVGFFTREGGRNTCTLVVEDGEATGRTLPEEIAADFRRAGIEGYENIATALQNEKYAVRAATKDGKQTDEEGKEGTGPAGAGAEAGIMAGTGEEGGQDSAEADGDAEPLRFASDRISVGTLEQGGNDEVAQQQRMDEIIEELIRLNRNGRTCLGRTSLVG